MSQEKRVRERDVWKKAREMLDLPPSTTAEGHAEYMRLRRQIESITVRDPLSLKEFLFHYEISREELLRALNQPAWGWARRKKKER